MPPRDLAQVLQLALDLPYIGFTAQNTYTMIGFKFALVGAFLTSELASAAPVGKDI